MNSAEQPPIGERIVFIVGARRSGTLWLQRMIAAHPRVASIPTETYLFSYGISQVFERLQHGLISSPRVAAVHADRDRVVEATRGLCDAIFGGFIDPTSDLLLERTPWHAHHLELITEIYPEARVLHMIRDGRDVTRSLVAQPWGPNRIGEAAEEWRGTVEAAISVRDRGRHREVRYESLLASPDAQIRSLYEWLELPVTDQAIEAALAEGGAQANLGADRMVGTAKWKREWGAAELAEFDRAAGPLLERLGYRGAAPDRRRHPLRAARRRLRARLRRGAPERAPLPEKLNTAATRPQEQLERVVELVQERRVDELAGLAAPAIVVRTVDGAESRLARGPAGLELLAAFVDGDPAFDGRQVLGESFPAFPSTSVSLAYRLADRSIASRVLIVGFAGERLTELTLIRPA